MTRTHKYQFAPARRARTHHHTTQVATTAAQLAAAQHDADTNPHDTTAARRVELYGWMHRNACARRIAHQFRVPAVLAPFPA